MLYLHFNSRGVLQKFCVANPFSAKNQQIDLKPKTFYSPDYNLLFDIITYCTWVIPRKTAYFSNEILKERNHYFLSSFHGNLFYICS